MERGNVRLEQTKRFQDGFRIPEEKLKKALKKAVEKLQDKADFYKEHYPGNFCKEGRYDYTANDNWVDGMHTGCYLLCYEATKDPLFLQVAAHHLQAYKRRLDEDISLRGHDVGFVYSPSCVAYYKITGDLFARDLALQAAETLYNRSYSKKGGFIMRSSLGMTATEEKDSWSCRTMMDTLMNIPLLYWKGQMTGEDKYTKAAQAQCATTEKYLIRPDGSSYHHYQFALGTHKPLHGLTFQGNRDESTWSRGHSWGVLGFPTAWNYLPEEYMMPLYRDIVYYFLNHLPEDFIPYWDFDFVSGEEPRDTSAGLISACGLLEAARVMPYTESEKEIFTTAAHKILNSIMDRYTTETGAEYDGLVTGVTIARKIARYPVEQCTLYGDYFYLEALVRLSCPKWSRVW